MEYSHWQPCMSLCHFPLFACLVSGVPGGGCYLVKRLNCTTNFCHIAACPMECHCYASHMCVGWRGSGHINAKGALLWPAMKRLHLKGAGNNALCRCSVAGVLDPTGALLCCHCSTVGQACWWPFRFPSSFRGEAFSRSPRCSCLRRLWRASLVFSPHGGIGGDCTVNQRRYSARWHPTPGRGSGRCTEGASLRSHLITASSSKSGTFSQERWRMRVCICTRAQFLVL